MHVSVIMCICLCVCLWMWMSVFAYVSWCGYVIMVLMYMSVYIGACVTGICVVCLYVCVHLSVSG